MKRILCVLFLILVSSSAFAGIDILRFSGDIEEKPVDILLDIHSVGSFELKDCVQTGYGIECDDTAVVDQNNDNKVTSNDYLLFSQKVYRWYRDLFAKYIKKYTEERLAARRRK